METIRSGFTVDGVRLFCQFTGNSFLVESRWQRFHKTSDIHEALAVFEGLCLEELPTRKAAKTLILEARRNRRNHFTTPAAWENRVIECARRRSEGLVPVSCGHKGNLEKWIAA